MRFYAHYTFIYPDTFIKKHIVELTAQGRILSYYPFEREIAGTEFFSGILIFIPQTLTGKINIGDLADNNSGLAAVEGYDYLIRSFLDV